MKHPTGNHDLENQETEKVQLQEEGRRGFCAYILILLSAIVLILFLPLTIFTCVKVVRPYERAIIFRLGRVKRNRKGETIQGSGLHILLPCVDQLLRVDLRTKSINISPQEVLTRDAVTVNVDAVVYMRVTDPSSALMKVEDATDSSQFMAVSTLRTVLGTYELTQLLTDRDEIDTKMQKILDEATEPWGIRVGERDHGESSALSFVGKFSRLVKDRPFVFLSECFVGASKFRFKIAWIRKTRHV